MRRGPLKLKISQRPEEFFSLFTESARNLRAAAELLTDLIEDYRDVELKASRIRDREHEGDEITHAIIRRLNTTFVTPMDREDIYLLGSALDDVLDAVEAVSDLFNLHHIESPLPEMKAQADVLLQATKQTERALEALPRMQREQLEPYWVEINRLENEGDRIVREALASLFERGIDPMMVIRWKDIFERLEDAIDATETAANILEGIVIKNT
jgi:uncharacterized protein